MLSKTLSVYNMVSVWPKCIWLGHDHICFHTWLTSIIDLYVYQLSEITLEVWSVRLEYRHFFIILRPWIICQKMCVSFRFSFRMEFSCVIRLKYMPLQFPLLQSHNCLILYYIYQIIPNLQRQPLCLHVAGGLPGWGTYILASTKVCTSLNRYHIYVVHKSL